jgi:hypothetical protein
MFFLFFSWEDQDDDTHAGIAWPFQLLFVYI